MSLRPRIWRGPILRSQFFRTDSSLGRTLALPLTMMKHGKTIHHSKHLLATTAALVISLLASNSQEASLTSASDTDQDACEGLCGTEPSSSTSMGRFLETQIAERVERVSGKTWTKLDRLKMARELSVAIAKASYEFDVDPFLLLAMVEVESRYNKMAVGTVGERGLLQIRPQTAKWIIPVHDELHECDLHEVGCNISTGAKYLGYLETQTAKREIEFESPLAQRAFVLRSYNLGPARAYRLAMEQEVELESDRMPATSEAIATEPASETPTVLSYADKISTRASRFQSWYLQAATSKQVVTTVALAN